MLYWEKKSNISTHIVTIHRDCLYKLQLQCGTQWNQVKLPLPSAWRCPCRRTQTGVSSASPRHSSPATTRCKCSSSFCWKPTQKPKGKKMVQQFKQIACKKGWTCTFCEWPALMGGLVSTGAPSAPPARLFFRFSWTWVSRSSRSTLSASLARQASSSWFTRLFREDFLLSASQKVTLTVISSVRFNSNFQENAQILRVSRASSLIRWSHRKLTLHSAILA